MDTETFIVARQELCHRLEARRLITEAPAAMHWTRLFGNSFLSVMKVAFQMGGRRQLESWLPRLLMTVAAPAIIGFLKDKELPFFGKKSLLSRFSSFIPFLKSI